MRKTPYVSCLIVLGALAVSLGCSKPSSEEVAPVPAATPSATSVTTASSAALPVVPAGTPASATASTAAAPGAHAAATTATAAAPAGARSSGASVASAAPAAVPAPSVNIAPAPAHYASVSAGGNNYAITVSARDNCAVGAECTGTISLTASGGYHINDEYPYKFMVDDVSGASWLTSDGKGFGKTTGEFKKTTATTADLTIRYRGTQAVVTRLSGTYKMSVCSEANCQVETVPLAVNVTFTP